MRWHLMIVAAGLALAGVAFGAYGEGPVQADTALARAVHNSPVTDLDGDADGDGFTNAEEWRYIQYYGNDPDEQRAAYLDAIATDATPAISHHCYAAIETVTVSVGIIGKGHVYLGDRDVAISGSWDFARWALDCPTPCHTAKKVGPDCALNTIVLAAEPDPGSMFRKWHNDLEGSHATAETLIMDRPCHVVAEFIERPGLAELNLVADLQALLQALGESESIDTFDRNDMGYTERNGEVVHVPQPNGIPDAAEFLLLETILKCVWLDLSSHNAVAHDRVWRAWQTNLELIATPENGLPNAAPDVRRALAAYLTFGDYFSAVFAELAAARLDPETKLAMEPYDNFLMPYFPRDEDADNDGVLNYEEWEDNAPDRLKFALAALDPQKGTPHYPVDAREFPDVAPGKKALRPQSGHLTHVDISTQFPGCRTYVSVGSRIVAPGTTALLSFGAEVTLRSECTTEDYEFSRWSAPETMANGSGSRTEKFSFTHETTVQGRFVVRSAARAKPHKRTR